MRTGGASPRRADRHRSTASPSSSSRNTTRPARIRPVREIAEAAKTGPATMIISGLAIGFENTALPVLAIAISLVASYYLGALLTRLGTAQRR